MAQQAPFEIIAAPYEVYVAPVGEAFPDIADAPAGAWELLGRSGSKNYDDEGVTITHEQTVEEFRPLGLAAPRKAFRTEEGLIIAFNLVDVSAAQYAKVINDATVTDTAAGVGTGGNLSFPLEMGFQVKQLAMLIRGSESPDATAASDDFNVQYEVPVVYQAGSPAPQYQKGEPARLACEFRALWDATSGFGTYRTQDAAAS